MLDIISHNPYRVLGVFANAAPREVVSNKGKITTFLRVNKQCSFPTDLPGLLGEVERSNQSINDADSRLAIESDRLRYAQFWFFSGSPFDMVTTNCLQSGDLLAALAQWKKMDSVPTLQNQAVCYLMQGDFRSATICLSKLYSLYLTDYLRILDIKSPTSLEDLVQNYISTLANAVPDIDISALSNDQCSAQWNQAAKQQLVEPLVKQLNLALAECKQTKDAAKEQRLEAGNQLNKKAKAHLFKLRGILPSNDMQLINISDKVANEILQCSIDFYNASDSAYAATEASTLLQSAKMLALGSMVKDRIAENEKTLNGILSSLPPKEVEAEDMALKNALNRFCDLPDLIQHSVTLLNEAEPLLSAIRQKLGASNAYYLERSSTIVNNALHNVIEEVNTSQNAAVNASGTSSYSTRYEAYKRCVNVAYSFVPRLRKLDMDAQTRTRFEENCKTLDNLYSGVQGSSSSGSSDGGGCGETIAKYIGYLIVYGIIMALVQMCS